MRKIAVVLSGCGFRDGSEITEAVSTLISLSELGAHVECFAPEMEFKVRDPVSGEATSEKRSVLKESARIARGQIQNLERLQADRFDGLIFPGGSGAARNLCSWAEKGIHCEVQPQVERVIREFYEGSQPIGAFCIAPVLIARVLGSRQVTLTIGNDPKLAAEIEKTGAFHEPCAVHDYITDREHKIITTPAYMLKAQPHEVFKGIRGAVRELVEMA